MCLLLLNITDRLPKFFVSTGNKNYIFCLCCSASCNVKKRRRNIQLYKAEQPPTPPFCAIEQPQFAALGSYSTTRDVKKNVKTTN